MIVAALSILLAACGNDNETPESPTSAATPTVVASPTASGPGEAFRLTILHHDNGNSKLINAGEGLEDFGGVARFATVVEQLRQEALADGRGVIMVSAGDNIRPGPQLDASIRQNGPFFDAVAMDIIGYDAIGIGHQDFNFGPDVLADFIQGFESPVPFISTNLDVSGEPRLVTLQDAGRLSKSIILKVDGENIGLISVVTPRLAFNSSPRNAVASPDVAGAIQGEVDALESRGINKIILLSNLQSIDDDISLLSSQVRGVDIIIGSGGETELQANPDSLLIPGDEDSVADTYPVTAQGKDGEMLVVVTTSGDYKYVGRLVVEFDPRGRVSGIDASSGPVRVADRSLTGGVPGNPSILSQVVEPVETYVDGLASIQVGTSAVALEGRENLVRSEETNEGNLVADALLWQAVHLADAFDSPTPDVAIQNGGGIRNDNVIPAGALSDLDLFGIAPFASFVTIIPGISASQFKEVLENAVSQVDTNSGRFAQIAGFTMVWGPTGTAQELDADNNVTTTGDRIRRVQLNDGTLLVDDGEVTPGARSVNIATLDFMARGGDQSPYRDVPFANLGVTYQQALSNYIQQGLNGTISVADYPEDGQGRITTSP